MKLTPPQSSLLSYIEVYRETYGFAPSIAEMCARFGWRSKCAAFSHLRALEKKGALLVYPNGSRAIAITRSEQAALRRRMKEEGSCRA